MRLSCKINVLRISHFRKTKRNETKQHAQEVSVQIELVIYAHFEEHGRTFENGDSASEVLTGESLLKETERKGGVRYTVVQSGQRAYRGQYL